MTQQPPADTEVFDAAKAIFETLRGLDKQDQARAIRFASEALGLSTPTHTQPSVASSQTATTTTPPSSDSQVHSTNIKQFTAAKAPKSDQQFAAVVAYFYRFEAPQAERKETIDAKTLQEAARLAGRRRPPRPQATLVNAKNAGYLDLVGRGKFKINAVGENLVAMTLPGNISELSVRHGGGRKKLVKNKPAKKARAKQAAKRGR